VAPNWIFNRSVEVAMPSNRLLNETHDPARVSWIESANVRTADFPIQNLPFGIFRRAGEAFRGGVAIGEYIFDMKAACEAELFTGKAKAAASAASGSELNQLLALGPEHWSALRRRLSELLSTTNEEIQRLPALRERIVIPMSDAELSIAVRIGSFTDFLCSLDHTIRSRMGAPPPAFHYMPIAYNSRATSVRLSGEVVVRPNGQFKTSDGSVTFGPEPSQDFELELGTFIGPGNSLGSPIPLREAESHIFGYCLLNDWSARGIQMWESHPLGPFLGKSLSTTISPWIVTAESMWPFHIPPRPRAPGEPRMPYLHSADLYGLDLQLEAWLMTSRMRETKSEPVRITKTNFKYMYWTIAQTITHHSSNGCNLQPGDLIGSGTVSGPLDEERACLAELSRRGSEPIVLPNGETRAWLQDGDEVIFRGRATRDGYVGIGFGECRGRLDPAPPWPR